MFQLASASTLPAERLSAASSPWPAATAAAEPPDEPPGTRVASQGLRAGPKAEFSFAEPIANSSQLSLPSVTAPACLSCATTVASNGLA